MSLCFVGRESLHPKFCLLDENICPWGVSISPFMSRKCLMMPARMILNQFFCWAFYSVLQRLWWNRQGFEVILQWSACRTTRKKGKTEPTKKSSHTNVSAYVTHSYTQVRLKCTVSYAEAGFPASHMTCHLFYLLSCDNRYVSHEYGDSESTCYQEINHRSSTVSVKSAVDPGLSAALGQAKLIPYDTLSRTLYCLVAINSKEKNHHNEKIRLHVLTITVLAWVDFLK